MVVVYKIIFTSIEVLGKISCGSLPNNIEQGCHESLMSPFSPVFHTVESVRLPFNSESIKAPSPAIYFGHHWDLEVQVKNEA